MPLRPTTRRWLRRLGIVLALVGLGFQGYIAWQYWGTTWVAKGKQADLVERLEEQWAALPPSPTTHKPVVRQQPRSGRGTRKPAVEKPRRPSSPVSEDPGLTSVNVSDTSASGILRIPVFGAAYAVPILEGTSPDVLSLGVGHFPDSAGPGEVGNYALAAHRITHGEPFRRLPDLRAGDLIVIDTARTRYTYVLDTDGNSLQVDFTENWVLDARPSNPRPGGPQPIQGSGQKLITLTTCAELFHTDSRLVAFGHLLEQVPRE